MSLFLEAFAGIALGVVAWLAVVAVVVLVRARLARTGALRKGAPLAAREPKVPTNDR